MSFREILEWDCFKINIFVKNRQDELVGKDFRVQRLMRYEVWVIQCGNINLDRINGEEEKCVILRKLWIIEKGKFL